MTDNMLSPYEEIGEDQLSRLVETFYTKVADHPDLAPIFPSDLTETVRKQKQFLTQYLGGPNLYTDEHGHPMLRARHMPFKVTPRRAQSWLDCMESAMNDVDIKEPIRSQLFHRLYLTAQHMINTPDDESVGD